MKNTLEHTRWDHHAIKKAVRRQMAQRLLSLSEELAAVAGWVDGNAHLLSSTLPAWLLPQHAREAADYAQQLAGELSHEALLAHVGDDRIELA